MKAIQAKKNFMISSCSRPDVLTKVSKSTNLSQLRRKSQQTAPKTGVSANDAEERVPANEAEKCILATLQSNLGPHLTHSEAPRTSGPR